ncbi:MAG: IS5/IS1182 family transposase [Gammaproteobacteria bacterium HGW-Gammaproteobacteria-6]|nr:MAG: IS5/IS1182 family transposase [Gammaproteobacteria bacterium HGW-Gammaproteobacteria-6]
MGYVAGESRTQGTLFPVSLDELLADDHVCRVIEAFVRRLDLGALGFSKASTRDTGRPPYDPADLLKLYIYGYLHQTRTSRRLEKECHRNVEVMWLLNRLAPDHKTIARFRQENGAALRKSCAAFVQFCRGAGLVGGEWVAIDGSKFRAVASSKAVWNAKRLAKEQQRLESGIASYLAQLDEADDRESATEIDGAAVKAALAVLESQLADNQQVQALLKATGRTQTTATEPEARSMKGTGPAYNVQSAVDDQHHLIVHHAVTDEATDNRSLEPMALEAKQVLAVEQLNVLADAGYANGEQVATLDEADVTAYVASNRSANNQGDGQLFQPDRFSHDPDTDTLTCPAGNTLYRKQVQRKNNQIIYSARAEDCSVCPLKSQCTQSKRRLVGRHIYAEALDRMKERTTAAHMKRRGSIVEHPFGTLKYQIFEKPRFVLRGLWGAGTEMALSVLVYNLKRAMNVLGNAEMRRRLATI